MLAKLYAALRRVPARVRKATDFVSMPSVRPARRSPPATSWTVETVRAAIDAQMRGQFAAPKRLAEAMRRDDAIYAARTARVLPVCTVATELRAHDSERGRARAKRASESVQVPRSVLASIVGTLVDHAVAIGYVVHETNEPGTRVDFRLTEWPLEHVRWNDNEEVLETTTDDTSIVPITHGDGRWIIFRKYATFPWREDPCVLPAGLVWAAHAEGVSDWQASSRAHGLAKIVGELPDGSAINRADDEIDSTAQEFIDMLQDLSTGASSIGLRPSGSEVEFLANGSSAWQVFAENIESREKAAARIYLGTDAILGSTSGAPGVDISALLGLASSRFQSDFDALTSGLSSGLYEPWCAINFGSSQYAPSMRFLLPDPDRDSKREESAANRRRLTEAVRDMREQKFEVTQSTVDTIAAELGLSPAPSLASIDQQTTSLTLAPTDIAKIVRVKEARAAQGLRPFGDERDDMTLTQLDAWAAAQAAPPTEPIA